MSNSNSTPSEQTYNVDFVQIMMKYIILGGSIAVAVSMLPKTKMSGQEVLGLALSASVVFLILDTYAPSISMGARHGAGFGIGSQLVGGLGFGGGKEGFESELNGDNSDSVGNYANADAPHIQTDYRNNAVDFLNKKAMGIEMHRYENTKGDFNADSSESQDFHPVINAQDYSQKGDLDSVYRVAKNNGDVLMKGANVEEGFTENYKLTRMSRLNKVGMTV